MKKLIALMLCGIMLAGCGPKSSLPYGEKVDFSWTSKDIEKKMPGGTWISNGYEPDENTFYMTENGKLSVASFGERYDTEEKSMEVFNKYMSAFEGELGAKHKKKTTAYVEAYYWEADSYTVTLSRNTPENMQKSQRENGVAEDELYEGDYRVAVTYEVGHIEDGI